MRDERMYKTYIFDLDGTLLDTLGDLTTSTNYALRQYGMPEHSQDDIRCFVGNGIRKLIERAVPDGKENPLFEQVFRTFFDHYEVHNLDTTKPYDGVVDMLRQLRERGCRLAIVSNKFCEATEALAKHFFADTIEVAIGENEAAGIRKKPAPDTIDEALHRLGVGKKDAVYVGDSDVDLMTARNSQLPCISVLWGFRSREFLLNHGATTFAKTPKEILTIHNSQFIINNS